jgi:hypothetical protein
MLLCLLLLEHAPIFSLSKMTQSEEMQFSITILQLFHFIGNFTYHLSFHPSWATTLQTWILPLPFLLFRYLSLWVFVLVRVVILANKHVMQATRRGTFPWEVFGDFGPFIAQESYQPIPHQQCDQ